MGDGETEDVERVLSQGVECWVGEAEDDGEDGTGDEAEERAPEEGDAPVLATCDDDIEIASKILPLLMMVSVMDNKNGSKNKDLLSRKQGTKTCLGRCSCGRT